MSIELQATDDPRARARLLPRRGGLLTDLALVGDNRPVELLWKPDDLSESETGWPGGGMPLMFPFAGRVFHDGKPFQYDLAGTRYNMPLHGFAYALPWTVSQQSSHSVTLATSASGGTEQLYPFDFTLEARYELTPNALCVQVSVLNRGLMPGARNRPGLSPAMPVAIGYHPYFRMPLVPGAAPGDKSHCRLRTTAAELVSVTPAGGAGKAAEFAPPPDAGGHRLDQPLLANSILGKHAQPCASLVDEAAGLAVTVAWDQPEHVRYAVLWAKEGHDFHCLEPWMGLPDAVSTSAGAKWLTPGESLDLGFTISISTAN